MLKPWHHHRGFTLVELMVTLAVAALLLVAAVPSFGRWIQNAQIRSTAESLQNGLRRAQTEAVTRGTQTVFVLSTSAPAWNAAPAANAANWSVRAQPLANSAEAAGTASDQTHPLIEGSTYGSQTTVSISGPALLCFNSGGRLITSTAVAVPNVGSATCGASPAIYDIKRGDTIDADHKAYRVTVTVGGRVRMCDLGKTLSSDNPDGC
jgi:type IV fimbrial biogenesis protein FimT